MRQDKARKAKERTALELKKINQARSSEEVIRLCKQYIYQLHQGENERKEAARFRELKQKESNELKLIKETVPQYVEDYLQKRKKTEMEGEQTEDEEEKECDAEDKITENLLSTTQMKH